MRTQKTVCRVMASLWLAIGFLPLPASAAKLIPGTSNSLPRLATSHGTYKLGKKPYPAGTREQWIAEGRVLGRAPEGYFPRSRTLKGAADNRAYLPPIGNQGSEGSCVHWAGAYYTKTANMKRKNPSLNVTLASNQCSPRFTYNLTNAGEDNGGWGHEPFEIFMRYGGASLKQKPYVAGQYTNLPTVADFVEGLHRRTTNYVWLWEWNPATTQINELKAFLDAGGVAACGVYAEDSFDAWGKGDAPWVGATCTENDINHMVTVCGYGPGYYLVANSWGTSFGSNGFIVVDSSYFENFFSDVMYPLEGSYGPATNYAKIQIQHGRRSDIRSLAFTVNGTTVWSNSPSPKNAPLGTGSFDTDTRANWQLAVDLSSAPWGAANVVTARCMDKVTGTAGSLTNFTLRFNGTDFVSSGTPVSIPDNTGVAAYAKVSPNILEIQPVVAYIPASASDGRQIAVTANVSWTAATNVPWISITGGSPGDGNGTVTYNVAANETASTRTGRVTVAGGGLVRTCTVIQAVESMAEGDFDGDGAADAAVFQPTGGKWSFLYSGGGSATQSYGSSAMKPVSADYDGDGRTDVAVYYPAWGKWYIHPSGGGADREETFGWSASIPLPGDYDGDGKADLAVYYQPWGRWYFRYSGGAPDYDLSYGWSATIPVPADYDGDGVTDLAVYHPSWGNWYIFRSQSQTAVEQKLGGGKALPVPADYDGDGQADVAVFTRSNATWKIQYSGGGSLTKVYGWSAVIPVPADYDGDGKADIAVYHPSWGNWYILSSATGATIEKTLGGTGKNPVLLNYLIHSWFNML